ncbi:hypothetical protein ACLD0V_11710 [Acinetobacter baumannii]
MHHWLLFLNHLCDEQRKAHLRYYAFNFLNHLCDEQPIEPGANCPIAFLNHLCDEQLSTRQYH